MNDTLNYNVHLGGYPVHFNAKFGLRNPGAFFVKHDLCYYFAPNIPIGIEKFGNDLFANQIAQARNSNMFLSLHGDADIDFESAEADYANTTNMFASISLTSNYYQAIALCYVLTGNLVDAKKKFLAFLYFDNKYITEKLFC